MAPPTSESTTSAERELLLTRVIDAPRALVFRAWTEPEHMVRWWGPKGFTTPSCTMDVRPGGAWRICMRGPDGVEQEQGTGTVLTLHHGLFGDAIECENHSDGWTQILERLADVMEERA